MNGNRRSKLITFMISFALCGLLSTGCGDNGVQNGEDAGISQDSGDGDGDIDGDIDGDGDADGDAEREVAAIGVLDQPPEEVEAGATLHVSFELLGDDNQRVEEEGVEVTASLNRHQFADGESQRTATTDSSGVALFELVFGGVDTGLALTASSDHPSLSGESVTTSFFRVVAGDVSANTSTISGTDSLADGESEAEITIVLLDAYDNPIDGEIPEFTASGSGNQYGDCSETDSEGISTCTMTSTSSGSQTLEITEPVAVVGDSITFLEACDDEGPFGGGRGSVLSPYLICSVEHLNLLAEEDQYLSDSFRVVRDIDLGDVANFEMIGSNQVGFDGYFDGGGHIIRNLTIEDDDAELYETYGLFRRLSSGGVITDLILENVDVSAVREYTGVPAGFMGGVVGSNAGEISGVHVSGELQGRYTGGIAGGNGGLIVDSSSETETSGSSSTGGLVGRNAGEIATSFSFGNTTGGGLVGQNLDNSKIVDSYSTATSGAAGLVVRNYGEIFRSYSSGNVVADSDTGRGLLITNMSPADWIEDSYWDKDTTGQESSAGGEPLTTAEFAEEDNFEGWDFESIWVIDTAPDGEVRPILRWQQ